MIVNFPYNSLYFEEEYVKNKEERLKRSVDFRLDIFERDMIKTTRKVLNDEASAYCVLPIRSDLEKLGLQLSEGISIGGFYITQQLKAYPYGVPYHYDFYRTFQRNNQLVTLYVAFNKCLIGFEYRGYYHN